MATDATGRRHRARAAALQARYGDILDAASPPGLVDLVDALETLHAAPGPPAATKQSLTAAIASRWETGQDWLTPHRVSPGNQGGGRAPAPALRGVVPSPSRAGGLAGRLAAIALLAATLTGVATYAARTADAPTPAAGGAAAAVGLPVPAVGESAPAAGPDCLIYRTVPGTGTPTIADGEAEARVRDGYIPPFRLGRPGDLLDAQLVAIKSSSSGPPAADPLRGALAWRLVFAWLPPADELVRPDSATFVSAFVDARTGGVVGGCTGLQPRDELPGAGRDRDLAPDTARALLPFALRTPADLPLTRPTTPRVAVVRLPDGGREAVLDYVAGPGDYLRLVVRDRPLPAWPRSTGTTTLAGGQGATFVDIGAAQTLSWSDGPLAYAIVAVRPAAYSAAELARVADSLR